MKYLYKPFIGIQDVSFGMQREAIRNILKSEYKEFMRNDYSDNSSDYYEKLGFFVEYSDKNICEAIEFTNKSNLIYNEEDLFSIGYVNLRNKYDKLSSKIEEEDEIGVTYHDLGFGVTCKFGADKIESIIIFSDSYW